MTTAVVHTNFRRPWLPALALLLSIAAVVVAVIALAVGPDSTSETIRQAQNSRIVSPVPASAAVHTATPSAGNAQFGRSLDLIIECGRRLPARC
jgi:hypothetical protein